MSKTQIATIMKKYFLAKDIYFFTFYSILEGTYDEENKIFTDLTGHKYPYMMSDKALKPDEEAFAAFHTLDLEDAKRISKSKETDPELIMEDYANRIDSRAYITGYNNKGRICSKVFNLRTVLKEDTKNEIDDYTPLEDLLEQFMLDTTADNKFTKEELQSNIEVLEYIEDTIKNAIDTANIKIDAIDLGEGYVEHLQKEIDKSNKIDDVKKNGGTVHSKEIKPAADKDITAVDKDPENDHIREIAKSVIQEKQAEVKTQKIIPSVTTIIKAVERIDIDDVFDKVTQTLIAQDEAALRAITEIARKELDPRLKADGILLTGSTGVGKTELMRLVAKYIDRPFYKINSTGLTIPGYTGTDIEEELYQLIEQCGGDVKKAEKAIIYFDEIDKKGSKDNSDVSGRGVLNVLLPFIEGAKYQAASDTRTSTKKYTIDTSNMTVILSGAFTEVYKHLLEHGMGFDKDPTPRYRQAEPADFVKYGEMTDEFMGRVQIIHLKDLTKKDLVDVLLKGNQSALKVQEEVFKKLGTRIRFTDGYINKVAEIAEKKKTGARGLKGIVYETTWLPFLVASRLLYGNHEMVFTASTVEDSSNFRLDGEVYKGDYQYTKKKKK